MMPPHTYRLPTEAEWELAAGHMPKDADFNCGAFDSKRTECRTEARAESRKATAGYPNVTFRIVREDK